MLWYGRQNVLELPDLAVQFYALLDVQFRKSWCRLMNDEVTMLSSLDQCRTQDDESF